MNVANALRRLPKPSPKKALSLVRSHIPASVLEHEPDILTGLAVFGVGVTMIETAKATPKALYLRDHRLAEENETKARRLYLDARAMAPAYVKPLASGAATVGLIIGANRSYANKYGVLAATASMAERMASTYEEKVIERLGTEEHEKILDEIDSECPFDDGYILQGNGDTLVYDTVTGHTFRSSREKILAAQGVVCMRLIDEIHVPLAELYFQLGLDDDFGLAHNTGWTYNIKPNIHFSSTLLPDGKTPKLAIKYTTTPLERVYD